MGTADYANPKQQYLWGLAQSRMIAKLQLKRAEQIEKHKDQQGKASEKIKENTNKQVEKKNIKVGKMKDELEKLQAACNIIKKGNSTGSKICMQIDLIPIFGRYIRKRARSC